MKIKTKERRAFGFDMIVGFGLLVLPLTAGMFVLMMDIWSLMRADNNLKIISYKVGMALTSLDKIADYAKYNRFEDTARILCPNATSSTFLKLQPGWTATEGVSDGNISLTVEADVNTSLLGTKVVTNKMYFPSTGGIDATLTLKCQN